jgi:hypothetical protein
MTVDSSRHLVCTRSFLKKLFAVSEAVSNNETRGRSSDTLFAKVNNDSYHWHVRLSRDFLELDA